MTQRCKVAQIDGDAFEEADDAHSLKIYIDHGMCQQLTHALDFSTPEYVGHMDAFIGKDGHLYVYPNGNPVAVWWRSKTPVPQLADVYELV